MKCQLHYKITGAYRVHLHCCDEDLALCCAFHPSAPAEIMIVCQKLHCKCVRDCGSEKHRNFLLLCFYFPYHSHFHTFLF